MLISEKRISNPRFLSDQFSLSVQLFEGSIYTVAVVCSFLASWWPQEPWNKHTGGGLAASLCTVCVPLPCNSHVTLTVVGVSAHLVNKQSVQTQKGSRFDSYSYHHSPLKGTPALCLSSCRIPPRLQEHFVPALFQPDNKDGVHTHHPASKTLCYRSVWERERTPAQVV